MPAQYLVADPTGFSRMASLVVPLADGSVGIVVDRARIVTGQGDARVAVDLPDQSITGAEKVPGRFGGGFLFWTTDSVLYRSDTFDGPLKPVVKVPDSVQSISFAPAFVLVRTNNGERWALSLPSGKRVAMAPLGMADEVALDDGRALAYTDQGVVFTSTDGGAHWTDMTTSVRSSPQKVARVEEDLWLFEASGSAQRLEVDGHLAFFDHPPVEKAVEVRPRDARWRGNDAPLREAFRGGAAIDEGTALVVSEGDLVRLDVRTGDVLSIVAGKLPPDSRCDAVPTSNDVLFTCVSRASGSASFAPSAFVVSHTLTDEAPLIEHTFAGAAPFYASDDGGLAYGGPCASAAAVLSPAFPTVGVPPRPSSACVRQPSGTWQEVDVAGASADGGVSTAIVSRWVPRADGRAVALVTDPTPGIFDPQTNRLIELGPDARDALGEGISKVGRDGKRYAYFNGTTALIDWSWSFTAANLLRGWNRQGGIVELSDDGKITRSPFTFESVAAGPYAIGRSPQGRLYQSTDHGSTWDEIATPPSGGTALELRSCSSAGCDLGGFYRVGWNIRPPRVDTAPLAAKGAAEIRRTPGVELSCRSAGPVTSKVAPHGDRAPEDLGLGATRLPLPSEDGSILQLRNPFLKWMSNPLHPSASAPDGENPMLRALFSGYATEQNGDTITVMGPNKNAIALRRTIAFVPEFDPAAPVRKVTLAVSDALAAGRNAGLTSDEVLQSDPTDMGALVVVTPTDPAAAGELVFQNPRGLLAVIHSNERIRIGWHTPQNDATVVSGVMTGADETALLEVETSGVGHVYKLLPNGTQDLFDVNPTLTFDAAFSPANPDSLAIGPHGELAVLRLASGSDPPSDLDPALLIRQAMPAAPLAPWSTLRLGDDPECKVEPGWRATIQTIAPWIRVGTPDLRVEDFPMVARVKWSAKHVCLEGVTVKWPNVPIRTGPSATSGRADGTMATWLVSRSGQFARVGIAEGVEWRQPMTCTLVTKP